MKVDSCGPLFNQRLKECLKCMCFLVCTCVCVCVCVCVCTYLFLCVCSSRKKWMT